MEFKKFIWTLVLLALCSCKKIEINLDSNGCKVSGDNSGAVLIKGNNKVTITLNANTDCFIAKASVSVERRNSAIGVKINKYYTGGKFTENVMWEHQALVSFGGYGTNQNGDDGEKYLAPNEAVSFKGTGLRKTILKLLSLSTGEALSGESAWFFGSSSSICCWYTWSF